MAGLRGESTAATVALVGCNKDKAPETGATTGEHLENAAQQATVAARPKATSNLFIVFFLLIHGIQNYGCLKYKHKVTD